MDLADACYSIAGSLPRHELYGLGAQLRRAAVSVAANIAEGHGRACVGDYLHHLSFAAGSLMEVDTLIRIAVRREYVDERRGGEALALVAEAGRMLSGLRRALRLRRRANPQPPIPNPQAPDP